MPDFLKEPFINGPTMVPLDVLIRLLVALVLGGIVSWIYRSTRKITDGSASFPVTLVFLTILIAMVTQVIGDNIARAFSLVGALSIVRFRTVVRDTQDTAYVIFAVVVGMAVGAQNLWVGLIGMGVVGLAAALLMARAKAPPQSYVLSLRVESAQELDKILGDCLHEHVSEHRLLSLATTKKGDALDVSYETRLRPGSSPSALLKALCQIEGVKSVELQRGNYDPD